METPIEEDKSPIAWMAKNPVAANLLMLIFLVGGAILAFQVKQEVFPEFTLDVITVNVPYLGASPEEVERGVTLSIEEEIRSIDGIKKVVSFSNEGEAIIAAELLSGVSANKIFQDVKNRIDGIASLPKETERPVVTLLEAKREVMKVIVYGDLDQKTLRELAEQIREELLDIEGITIVDLASVPSYEIAVDIPQERLREYSLTLKDIADIIRETALEIPGGGIKDASGEWLLRTKERRNWAIEFLDIPIVSRPDGSRVFLGQVADIKEAFEDTDEETMFNGKSALVLKVYRIGDQTPLEISRKVNAFIDTFQQKLPKNISLISWGDRSKIYNDRIRLLSKNAILGLVFVLLFLAIFLEPKLAFWVTLGIPISIIGSFVFFSVTTASINMVSLFAFIITLGIIVDDAVMVGENIYKKREQGLSPMRAAIEGAKEICMPISFAVLTNCVAFIPLLFVPGATGKIFFQIPAVVLCVFLVSWVESLFILPAHLSEPKPKGRWIALIEMPCQLFERWLKQFIRTVYTAHLRVALRYRYVTAFIGLALLCLAVSFVLAGFVKFSYLPRVVADQANAQVVLPYGTPFARAKQIESRLIKAANEVIQKSYYRDKSWGVLSQIGNTLSDRGILEEGVSRGTGAHLIGVQVRLLNEEIEDFNGLAFIREWRSIVGDVPGAESTSFDAVYASTGGMPIDIQISHSDHRLLELAAKELADKLNRYQGVSDIDNGVPIGKAQMSFTIRPEARSLGVTVEELATQVRGAFYGEEALRQQRGRHEVKVMVRLPEKERKTIQSVNDLIIYTPSDGEIPLKEAVDIELGRSYTSIRRRDGKRTIAVTADVDEYVANANEIIANVKETILPELMQKYSGLSYMIEGQQQAQNESLDALKIGVLIALLAIYALLAIPFQSYTQPLIVMLSIPFGIIGAIGGHLLLGYEISIISMFGIIALAGVVVNDSMVMIVTTNRLRKYQLYSAMKAIMTAAPSRFRPIVLTSLTTFFGLAPMIFERSLQARFLIPMAISLGFGILFSTFIILLLVPAVYMILEDALTWKNNRLP